MPSLASYIFKIDSKLPPVAIATHTCHMHKTDPHHPVPEGAKAREHGPVSTGISNLPGPFPVFVAHQKGFHLLLKSPPPTHCPPPQRGGALPPPSFSFYPTRTHAADLTPAPVSRRMVSHLPSTLSLLAGFLRAGSLHVLTFAQKFSFQRGLS